MYECVFVREREEEEVCVFDGFELWGEGLLCEGVEVAGDWGARSGGVTRERARGRDLGDGEVGWQMAKEIWGDDA